MGEKRENVKLKLNGSSRCFDVIREIGKLEGNLIEELKNATSVVTGSNTGIGKVTVQNLAYLGGTVVLACRNLGKANTAIEEIRASRECEKYNLKGKELQLVAMECDLNDLGSVKAFAEKLCLGISNGSLPKLRLLVYNAALLTSQVSRTMQGYESTFGVCHLGHYFLTREIFRHADEKSEVILNQRLRIVNVSSNSHYGPYYHTKNVTDENEVKSKIFGIPVNGESDPGYGLSVYGNAKLCNVLYAVSLSELGRVNSKFNVTSCSLHPGGFIPTELARNYGWLNFAMQNIMSWFTKDLDQGSATTLACSLLPDRMIHGQYFINCNERSTSSLARGSEGKLARELLWKLSEEECSKFLQNKL